MIARIGSAGAMAKTQRLGYGHEFVGAGQHNAITQEQFGFFTQGVAGRVVQEARINQRPDIGRVIVLSVRNQLIAWNGEQA